MHRRSFIISAASTLLLPTIRPAWAATDQPDFLSDDLPDYALRLGPAGLTPQGLQAPLPKEVAMARDIMAQAPRTSPHEIMAWLGALRETNQDGERYNEGWRERWNPVIVGFFAGTGTKPSGDETPWCAACLNWCIERSGLKGTGSASSGSFRDPHGLARPHVGDVAVFRDDARGSGKGHVGFYVGGDSQKIAVLGANQMNENGHHGICRKTFSVRAGRLVLDSFHPVSEQPGVDGGGRHEPHPAPRRDSPPPRHDDPPPRRNRPAPPPGGGDSDQGGISRW
jgi:uncharacterized protein (TIGR02594 family)